MCAALLCARTLPAHAEDNAAQAAARATLMQAMQSPAAPETNVPAAPAAPPVAQPQPPAVSAPATPASPAARGLRSRYSSADPVAAEAVSAAGSIRRQLPAITPRRPLRAQPCSKTSRPFP